nr:hypothetical protein [Treponema pedis]
MKTKKIFISFFILIVSCFLFAEVPSTEQMYKIFEEVFEGMNFTDDFTCSVSLIAEKPQTPKAVYQYKLYRRDSSDQTTLVLLAPGLIRGRDTCRKKIIFGFMTRFRTSLHTLLLRKI